MQISHHDQLHPPVGGLQDLDGIVVRNPLQRAPVDADDLVVTSQAPISVGNKVQ